MTPFERFYQDYHGKKVLIFGLGLLGRGIGDTALFAEIGAKVRVTDIKPKKVLAPALNKLSGVRAEYILGAHREEDIAWADVVIRNASVDWHHPLLELARTMGKPIRMDTELFVTYAGALTIGVTGTRGKTTTTLMIHHLVSRSFPKKQVFLGGNIKDVASLALLKQLKPDRQAIAVLELSSWQLQGFYQSKLSPEIAVLTNIYPDHLNKYASFERYKQDKRAIFIHQTKDDHLILNQNQAVFQSWAKQAKATVHWFEPNQVRDIELKLPGEHNRENAAAAAMVGEILGIPQDEIVAQLEAFTPVPQRLELIATVAGVACINDSTSTTPIATIKALQACKSPIYLIFGGEDKNLPVGEVAEEINHTAEKVYLLKGGGTEKVKELIHRRLIGGEFSNLEAAVTAALSAAQSGSTLLFSPGFTSFGMYQNEYERGDDFGAIIAKLARTSR